MTLAKLPIVDAHLDLAENGTLFGRDLTQSVAQIRRNENRLYNQATVSLPELERGGIAVAFATITPGFLVSDVGEDFRPRSALYRTALEAEAQALRQVALYESWEAQAKVRLIKSVNDLEDHLTLWQSDSRPGLVLLMESADSIVRVSDLSRWWRRGLRIIGLTFGDTRYGFGVAGGTQLMKQGGLTTAGLELLDAMADQGLIWDISHLTDEGIWQGLSRGFPRVCASHANARALTPTNRHLSDDVIRAIAQCHAVIGLVLYNGFLEPRWKQDRSPTVTLEHFRRHAEHIATLVGWHCIGIGSDLDGGFGRDECPVEIDSIADIHRVQLAVPPEHHRAVLSDNWLNFLRWALPREA